MSTKTKILTLLLAFFSTAIFAQTPSQNPAGTAPSTQNPSVTSSADKHADMKDLRNDGRTEHKEKVMRKDDIKDGNKAAAKEETKDIKADKKDIRSDAKDLKQDGVKHPVRRAHHQIRHRHH